MINVHRLLFQPHMSDLRWLKFYCSEKGINDALHVLKRIFRNNVNTNFSLKNIILDFTRMISVSKKTYYRKL